MTEKVLTRERAVARSPNDDTGARRLLFSCTKYTSTTSTSVLAFSGLIAITVIGAYLRYANLATNPGWDGDEGYNINIAWNLAQGKMQMFATTYAFVQHPLYFIFSWYLFSKL